MWIYIFEDCDMCDTRGHYPRVLEDGEKVMEHPCELCQGKGRRPTNMSFSLPATLLYPGGVDEELAAP